VNLQHLEQQYERILQSFLEGRGEDQLYMAQQLSKWLVSQNIAPEDIIDLHLHALERTIDVPEAVKGSFQLLTEVMIEYGIAYREHRILRSKQQQLESEMEVAAAMQQTLLPSTLPILQDVEVGLLSVPAKKMSGDYYNFVQDSENLFHVAIADIVGKGVPAALCMSMIKYAMDVETGLTCSAMLSHLNRVVERNIGPSMFITMLCGTYDTSSHVFHYAVAGHEPGLLYRASEDRFIDLQGQGLVLGVMREVDYAEYQIALEKGDMIILFTDGVTERKIGNHYLQREDLVSYIHECIHLPSQKMIEDVYRKLLLLSDFELPDDHTMVAIRRKE